MTSKGRRNNVDIVSEDVLSRSQAPWRRGKEALALCAALSQAVYCMQAVITSPERV